MTFGDAERALKYLADSEEEYARLKAQKSVQPERIKIVEAQGYLDSTETTIDARKADARSSRAYEQEIIDMDTIEHDYILVHEKRKRAEITIEVWRSWNAAKQKGIID